MQLNFDERPSSSQLAAMAEEGNSAYSSTYRTVYVFHDMYSFTAAEMDLAVRTRIPVNGKYFHIINQVPLLFCAILDHSFFYNFFFFNSSVIKAM